MRGGPGGLGAGRGGPAAADYFETPAQNSFHPADLFAAYPALLATAAVRNEHGYELYANVSRRATGGRCYWDTAGRALTGHLWRAGVLVATKAFTSVVGVAAFAFDTAITLDPYVRYAISVVDQAGGKYIYLPQTVTAASLDPAAAIAGAYTDAFKGAVASSEKIVNSGDLVYTRPVFNSTANTYPNSSLLGSSAGIVGVELVISL